VVGEKPSERLTIPPRVSGWLKGPQGGKPLFVYIALMVLIF